MGLGKAVNKVQEVIVISIQFCSVFMSPFVSKIFDEVLALLNSIFSFDELLELSQRGDNRTIDMLVGDIYSGMDYSKVYVNLNFHSFYSGIYNLYVP